MRNIVGTALVLVGCGGGADVEKACDDYTAAVTACLDEAYADDPAGHDEAMAGLVTKDCGVDDTASKEDLEEGKAFLECATAAFEDGDCSTPDAINSTISIADCQ
jgi:hypothetical protein